MVYKECVGDYPLLDYPCEHWWVRYGTGCTYLKNAQEAIWKQRLADLEKKYNYQGFSSTGSWKLYEVLSESNLAESKIFVYQRQGNEQRKFEVTNICSELYQTLRVYLQNKIEWGDCPYDHDHQSKCPFYKPNYTNVPIEELRQRKGYST